MTQNAIVISDLFKTFKIHHEKKTTLYEYITGILNGNQGYEEFVSLKNINFTVKKGEAVGIIGENGSGKSTLLKIIANILRPSKGSVTINGKITPFLELGVGFQPDLTAKENIYVYGTIMGLTDDEIDTKLDKILDFSGLKKFKDTKLKNLSSGMQVRLAFATAIQTDPDILLMDEVLAVGDMEFQQKCLDVFQKYLKKKKTIVFVSHDLNAVRRFCNKAVLLRHGEQIAFGNTNEIIDRYIYGIGDEKEQQSNEKNSINDENTKKRTRWGNSKVEIVDVKFLDKFKKENAMFDSGDPVTIKIKYKVNKPVDNLVIGIAIYSYNDIMCYGTNTDIQEFIPSNSPGINEIKLLIHNLNIIEGKFYLTVAAHSKKNIAYDWLDKHYSFNILKKGNNTGLFEIPCEWRQ